MDFARFGAWFQSRFDRFRAKNLTVGGVFGTGVILAAFFVVTLWPAFRSEKLDWHSWDGGWKRAISLSWIPLVAALYLKYSETFKRSRAWDRSQRTRRVSRQVITGKAIRDLCINLRGNKLAPQDMLSVRESILQSVALGVGEVLGLGMDQRIVANLLEFTDRDCVRMRVVCRSTRERHSGVEYPRDNLVAWASIRDARIKIVDDVRSDPRWEGMDAKPYRSIAAVPVGFGGRAFAAISVDCDLPYAFYGHSTDLATQLEPYAATLAMTYTGDAHYHECHYEPSHSA